MTTDCVDVCDNVISILCTSCKEYESCAQDDDVDPDTFHEILIGCMNTKLEVKK
jgi:hypothetical protein